MVTDIDWSKVKKSPVPKGEEFDHIAGWYRGSGIKIGTSLDGMRIFDDAGSMLAFHPGDFSKLATGEVKQLAAKVLAQTAPGTARIKVRYEVMEKVKRRSGMKGRVKLVGMRHRSRSGRKVAYR